MVLSIYAKQRILLYWSEGYSSSNLIQRMLKEKDGICVSRVTVWKFLCGYAETGSVGRKEGSGRPSKITPQFIQRQMETDDETTATQLCKKLTDNGFSISITTIVRCRNQLGWTYRGA